MADFLAAGPSGLDDWIQAIILILVIAGSALGAVSKKLIEFFSPREEEGGEFKPTGERPDRRKPPPAPPARPIGGGPHVPSDTPPWLRRPEEQREYKVRRSRVERLPPPAGPIPAKERQARPLRRPPIREAYSPQRTRRRAGAEVATADLAAESGDVIVGEVSLGHLASFMEQADAKSKAAATKSRPGRDVQSRRGIAAGARSQAAPSAAVPTDLDLASPAGLRRAIVLSEILGPPVAFRDPERHI